MEAKGHCCSANLGGQCQPMLPHDICGDDEYTGDIYSTADECKKECSCGNGKVENNEVCDLGKAGYEGADAGEDGKPGIGAHKMNVFSPGLPQNTPIAISIIPIASSREVPFSKAWQDNMIADGCLDTCKYAICYVEDPMAKTARKCYAEFTTDDPDNPTAICEIDITIPGVYIGDYAVVVNEDPGQDNSRCAGLMMKGRGINGEENPPHFSVREGPPELVIDLPK